MAHPRSTPTTSTRKTSDRHQNTQAPTRVHHIYLSRRSRAKLKSHRDDLKIARGKRGASPARTERHPGTDAQNLFPLSSLFGGEGRGEEAVCSLIRLCGHGDEVLKLTRIHPRIKLRRATDDEYPAQTMLIAKDGLPAAWFWRLRYRGIGGLWVAKVGSPVPAFL